eukprot:scaffold10271_cov119-Skeletonema_dohrnii-CCMP3373.AAC.2
MEDNAIDPCNSMPLAEDTEWSLIGVNIAIPVTAVPNPLLWGPPDYSPIPPLPGICPLAYGIPPKPAITMAVCVAVSLCDLIPSIAFSIKGETLACLFEKPAIASGIGVPIIKATQYGVDSVSAGFSLTNAFEIEITSYNGRDLFFVKANPTVSLQIKLSFASKKIQLPEWFSLSFTAIIGIVIQAPTNGTLPTQEEVETSIGKFEATNSSDGDEFLSAFSSWTLQVVIE